MSRPAAATEVSHHAEEIAQAAVGEVPEMMRVLRALRAGDSSVVPQTDSGRLEAVDTRLGAGPVAWAVEAARASWSRGVSSSDHSPVTADDAEPACARLYENLLLDILVLLADGDAANGDAPHCDDLSREIGRSGGDLAGLFTRLRGAQRFWTGLLLDHAVGLSARARVLREITVVVGARLDRLVDEAVTVRSTGQLERSGPRHDGHRRLVESLMAGLPVDPQSVSTELGLDLRCSHVALVLTRSAGFRPHDDELDIAAGCAARALGGRIALRHDAPDGALCVWVAPPDPAVPARLDAAQLGATGLRVGIGGNRTGLVGLRRSLLEARDAHRFSDGPRGPVVCYQDVAFAALLNCDPERARWFVTTQLGPLAGDDRASEELRRTLCTYYTSGMRLASTAAALHLHRNTLVNRLHRIEKLLGREVAEHVAETHSALLLIDDAGSSIMSARAGTPGGQRSN